MLRALSLASLLLLVGGEQGAGATLSTQNCSEGLFWISGAVVAGSLIYDIGSAPASARRYNRTHLSIAPLLDPRHGSYGLSASWSLGHSSRAASRPAAISASTRPARYVAVPARAKPADSTGAAPKSPSTAFALSFTSTAAPILAGALLANSGTDAGWVMIFAGGIIGPSVGHFYAGEAGRGLATAALRAGGTAVGLYAIAPCFDD